MREWLPPKRFPKLSVAIPASLVSDIQHLREKTFKIGLIGRALAIFRIDEIIIFPDRLGKDQSKEANLIATILTYMETPQYLRKFLFKITPELRYAGVLPPLRTPHHPIQNRKKDLKAGEYREGVVVQSNARGIFVEIGVEHPIMVPSIIVSPNTRVTIKIISDGKHPKVEISKPEEIEVYWGYKVSVSRSSLRHIIKEKTFDLIIATSRRGKLFTKVADDLLKAWKKSENVLVAFGSPTEGLYEILSKEKLKLNDIADFVVNTIPNQATETVRTEEAVYATLAVLNLLTTA